MVARIARMVFVMHDTAALLAALARCDRRTADRALHEGVDAIRVRRVREDIQAAAESIGVDLPATVTGTDGGRAA